MGHNREGGLLTFLTLKRGGLGEGALRGRRLI